MAVDIDVENGDVELAVGGDFGGLSDVADSGGDLVTEIGQHILEQHADEIFVFDNEHARG